ncbi:MAG TPA: radical SAM family heme chaperone HemW [Candidatus Omnitrophota bacterium]|nr:radical SAM family heme chaperone HemW [Candidatus Omnitrophota bacterium]
MNSSPNIQPALKRGLYVHIPFCLKKCHYCDFVITTKRDPATKQSFFSAFEAELKHSVSKYGRLHFDTLYFGGGTPSALEPGEFDHIHGLLTRAFEFKPGFEFTVEVNPGDINSEKVQAYRRAGVNRVSLGAQAMQEELLRDMNRPHGVAEIDQTVALLRQAGIKNVSMDMILNLPGQTLANIEETVSRLVALGSDQISVYDLDVHEKTAYGQRRREGRLKLASEAEHAVMAEQVVQGLESAGFIHYELSNFAKPGFESRHNLIYWNNQSYLGLGPGAFSYMNGIRYQFSDSVDGYFRKTLAQDWTNQTEDRLTEEEIEKESFLTGIRLKEGMDLRRLDILRDPFEKESEIYIQEGLLEKDEFRLKFTPKGKPLAELILRRFAKVHSKP